MPIPHSIYKISKDYEDKLVLLLEDKEFTEDVTTFRDYDVKKYIKEGIENEKISKWGKYFDKKLLDVSSGNSGLLILSKKDKDYLYCIPFGRGTFKIIEQYIDPEFPLELAERTANSGTLSLLSTKVYYGGKARQTIQFGRDINTILIPPGETCELLEVKVAQNDSKRFKKESYGNAYIFKQKVVHIESIVDKLNEIEENLNKDPEISLARTQEIKGLEGEELKKELSEIIFNKLMIGDYEHLFLNGIEFSIREGKIIYGSSGALWDSNIMCSVDNQELIEYDLQQIREYLVEKKYTFSDFLEARIFFSASLYSASPMPLIKLLEFCHDCYWMRNGRVYKFNGEFQEVLEKNLNTIDLEVNKQLYSNYLKSEFKHNEKEQRESRFIDYLCSKNKNTKKIHPITISLPNTKKPIEFCDMYRITKRGIELHFVKLGPTLAISEVIEQVRRTLYMIKQEKAYINVIANSLANALSWKSLEKKKFSSALEKNIDIIIWVILNRKIVENEVNIELIDLKSINAQLSLMEISKTLAEDNMRLKIILGTLK